MPTNITPILDGDAVQLSNNTMNDNFDSLNANKAEITELANKVVGPISAVEDNIATYDGTTGKLIKDGGVAIGLVSGAVQGPASATDNAIARFDDVTGKLIQDSNVLIDDLDNITGANEVTVHSLPLFNVLGNRTTTGIIEGGVLSINAGDTDLFDMSAGCGYIVDNFSDPNNPDVTFIEWTAFIGVTPAHSATTATYLAIQESASPGIGEIVQQASSFTNTQKKSLIVIGNTVNAGGASTISNTVDGSHYIGNGYLASGVTSALGRINLNGNDFGPGTGALELRKEAGNTFEENINRDINILDPHVKTDGVIDPATWTAFYNDGAGGVSVIASQTDIDPDLWDDGSGVLQSVPNNRYTNQVIYYFPDSEIVLVQFGEKVYTSLNNAVNDFATLEVTQLNPGITTDAVRTVLAVQEGTTDLAAAVVGLTAQFLQTGKFGLGSGGGSSGSSGTQDLQDVYDNSTTPEIITDATRGALTFKRGSAADTDNVFEVQNNAGTNTAAITGEGEVVIQNAVTAPLDGKLRIGSNTAEGNAIHSLIDGDILETQLLHGGIFGLGEQIAMLTSDGTNAANLIVGQDAFGGGAAGGGFNATGAGSEEALMYASDTGTILLEADDGTNTNSMAIHGLGIDNQGYYNMSELGATPTTPASGEGLIYFKNDGIPYSLNDAGTETALGGGGGGGGESTQSSFTSGEALTAGDALRNGIQGDSIYISQSTGTLTNAQSRIGYNATYDYEAQSFTVSGADVKVKSIIAGLSKNGTPTGDLTMTIYSDTGTTTVATATNTINEATLTTSVVDYTFNFSEETLSAGTYYMEISHNRSSDTGDYSEWAYASGTPYAGGTIYIVNDAGSWTNSGQTDYDRNFELIIVDETEALEDVFKTDASDETTVGFIGFADTTVGSGVAINVNTAGVDANQTGLSIGSDYYLSDTAGAISLTPGTNEVKVGRAVDTTSILIDTFPVASGGSVSYAMVQYSAAITSLAANATAPLDTEVYDDDGIVSLSANTFTLIEGTYIVSGTYNTFDSGGDYGYIYNNSDASKEYDGSYCFSDTSDPSVSPGSLAGIIIVPSGGKTYSIRSGAGRAAATSGAASSTGDFLQFTKIA